MADVLRVHAASLAAVQDLGRIGHARLGVPPNGASDQFAMSTANALVGNAPGDRVIENTLLELAFSVSVETVLTVTGSPATVTISGDEVPQWTPLPLRADEVVRIKRIRDGLHVYVALAGALEAPLLLGSCAPDPLIRFGTRLRDGDELPFRGSRRRLRVGHPVPAVSVPAYGSPWRIDVCDGPEVDWFRAPVGHPLDAPFVVSKESNHVGMRLAGDTPAPHSGRELVSRAVPTGAVEIPRSGEVIVLRRGRGVTAGYPVVGVVTSVAQSRIAQARPGHSITFRPRRVADAQDDHRVEREHVRAVADRADTYLTSP